MEEVSFESIGSVYAKAQSDPESKPFAIALKRGRGEVKVMKFRLPKEGGFLLAERMLKTMLYAFGGYDVWLKGDAAVAEALIRTYAHVGARAFDVEFMEQVYGKPFTIRRVDRLPQESERPMQCASDPSGNRIGFDAGGSDRKATALKDGKIVFQDETVWFPKLNSDPAYHKAGIYDSIDRAVAALGCRPDFIGVSSAGIMIGGAVRVASLFRAVPAEAFEREIVNIYTGLSARYGCPVKVANDGDVAALAAAEAHPGRAVLGLALGTSLAAGYADENRAIKGYLNELAFVPVDLSPEGTVDEWSLDKGVGGKYLSQDGVIRLAELAGIELVGASPAERLKEVQAAVERGDERAKRVYERMGDILGQTLSWFCVVYPVSVIRLMGRAVSGKGGDIAIAISREILKKNAPEVTLELPDETERRLGQSYTAALM